MSVIKIGNRTVKCQKSLYKSTYEKNAFIKNKNYFIVEETDKFFYILDEEKRQINFAKENHGVFYFFDDYFKLN